MTRDRWLAVALGVLTLVMLVTSAPEYGLTYDEPVYSSRTFRVGEWLGLLFTAPTLALEHEKLDRAWNPTGDEQPGLMKLIAWPATMLTSSFLPVLAAMRMGTMLLVACLIGAVYLFVAGRWGRAEGVMAALGLLFMPNVFAHSHLLAQDAPVMTWSFLAVAASWHYARRTQLGERPAWGWMALAGLACGAAVATKVNGLFVPFVVLPWVLVYRRRAALPLLISMAVLGFLVFFAAWPWLWHDTATRLGRYLAFFGKHYPVSVTYFGTEYNYAPWHFPLVMVLLTTPPVALALAAVGVWRGTAGERRVASCERRATADGGETEATARATASGPVAPPTKATGKATAEATGKATAGGVQAPALQAATATAEASGSVPPPTTAERRGLAWLMVWGIVANLLPVCLPSSPKYNGVRLFLPVFPYLAILAAVGFGALARGLVARVGKDVRERRLLLGLCLVAALAPGLMATAQTHPYGMSYYNVFVGGLRGAEKRGLEATYWGETFFAAVPWLNQKAPEGATVWISVPGFVSSVAMYQSFGLLRPDIRLSGGDDNLGAADLAVVVNKPTEWSPPARELVGGGQALFVQELQGVPLTWVFAGPHLAAAGGVKP